MLSSTKDAAIITSQNCHALGMTLLQSGMVREAVFQFRKALAMAPRFTDAYLCLGHCLGLLGKHDEAIEVYDQALGNSPETAVVWNNRGNALLELRRYCDATESYSRALRLAPDFHDARVALATCYQALGEFSQARSACETVLKSDPRHAEAHWNRALLLLLNGEYPEGWREYEWRWLKRKFTSPLRDFAQPPWQGEPVDGKTVLIHAEQGFGDAIHFCRYVPLVAALGARVVFECHPPLVPLMRSLAGGSVSVVAMGEPLPAHDLQVPLMSLPKICGTTVETIPGKVPYLAPPGDRVAFWQSQIVDKKGFKVGICWAGKSYPDPGRSCPAELLAPLAEKDDVSFYSLQMGWDGALPLAMSDLTGHIRDFGDTAALIARLDLVITIDTAVAHLAGAMGTATWVMLPYAADWRWMIGRDDSPWYPTMRLFRQALPGDWQDVIHRMACSLRSSALERSITVESDAEALKGDGNPVALNNLGQTHHAHARLEEAVRCYREAIALKPDYVTAYNNLGAVLQESGRAAEAESVYRQALALRPGVAELHCNLANALQDLGRWEEAEQACCRAVALNPGLAAAHNSLANALRELERLEEAEQACLRALAIQPAYAKAYNTLGTILHGLGRLAEAEQACRRAVEITPTMTMAYNNLGAVLRGLSRPDESEQALRRALDLMPGHAGTLDNLAVTLKEQGRLEEAKDASVRALAADPASAQALGNLGVINMELGLPEEASEAFRQALVICPDNGEAHWNLGLLHLQQGDFEAGWQGYEWRLKTRKDPHGWLRIPRYGGSDLRGKTVFVYAEQGVGEELMFSSCLDDIAALAGHIVFECDSRLVPLFARSFPGLTVIPATGGDDTDLPAGLPPMDFKLPLGSLPRYFRNSWGDFKGRAPWLTPCPDALQKWCGRYDALGDGLKVGIAWRGGLKQELSRLRSTHLGQWKDLFAVSGVHFINLQYGDCSGEIRELREQCGTCIHSWEDVDQLRDMDDFAAQVAGLDLVVTIDNTTAHMAGALGRPVWCLLSCVPNWRWMLNCENSPWYPTMRIFRQKRQQDWESVFAAVAGELPAIK